MLKYSPNWYLKIEFMLRITGIWTRTWLIMVVNISQSKPVYASASCLLTLAPKSCCSGGAKLSQFWEDGRAWLLSLLSTGVVLCWHVDISSRLSILRDVPGRCDFSWNTDLSPSSFVCACHQRNVWLFMCNCLIDCSNCPCREKIDWNTSFWKNWKLYFLQG